MKSNKPKYQYVLEEIFKKIQNEQYSVGELIPKEIDLSKQFKVSRATIRQAIQILVNKGYLERKKRRGTIVRQKKIEQDFTHIIESYSKEMSFKGLVPQTKVLFFKETRADKNVALQLKIKQSDFVYKLIRLRYANEQPIVLVESFIPEKIFPELINYDLENMSLYDLMEKNKLKVRYVKRTLEIMKADETVSELLNVSKNDPIFLFHTVGHIDNEIPIEYSIAKYRGDINSFKIEIRK
ncbi:transcriptional regulator [Liquorilactobacillus ghanensis DSM 18630]|uniref:Transcriptional regulator n=1 Tax=Liquorilactobacillus ghanensis DSM 18630 TaxID=1423750 RepID=A0A0R1VK92_9LACO|nr:GntR family transcriptional regulator [Liquorilactobacillus ghanensis]KRM05711.1 transcriptional regulator [Liquorilactobacillus ghanensis DSM 18630]